MHDIVSAFDRNADAIAPAATEDRFGSDRVLALLRDDLVALGFEVEAGKRRADKIQRPVFFGDDGEPSLSYEIDAYNADWRCGLEVEAGRGLLGGAIYRDLIQAMVMTGVDHLVVALLNCYQPTKAKSTDFDKAKAIAAALYGHRRVALPFRLTLIGYGPIMQP
ncbi:MAG: hypothetical protein AAGI53_09880 [Planctomycetota bacterium]